MVSIPDPWRRLKLFYDYVYSDKPLKRLSLVIISDVTTGSNNNSTITYMNTILLEYARPCMNKNRVYDSKFLYWREINLKLAFLLSCVVDFVFTSTRFVEWQSFFCSNYIVDVCKLWQMKNTSGNPWWDSKTVHSVPNSHGRQTVCYTTTTTQLFIPERI